MSNRHRRALAAPAGATAVLLVPLAALDRKMQRTGGKGIIAFELAGSKRSREILRAWGVEGRRAARRSLLLDYPFLIAYTTLNIRLTRRAAEAAPRTRVLMQLGPLIASLQVLAGACDAIENAALLKIVSRGPDADLATLARNAARGKFAGLSIGWAYFTVAALRRR